MPSDVDDVPVADQLEPGDVSTPEHVFDDDMEALPAPDVEHSDAEHSHADDSGADNPDAEDPDAEDPNVKQTDVTADDSISDDASAAADVAILAEKTGNLHLPLPLLEKTDSSHSAVVPTPTSSEAPSAKREDTDEVEDEDLFTKLSTAPSSVSGLVTDWLNHVQLNGPAAVAELFSLLVRLARPVGASPNQLITSSLVIRNEPHVAVDELAHVLRTDEPGPVPAVAKDPASRRVRRTFEDFWRRLPAESSQAVLFDTDCFDTLINWLEAMAAAKSRALRMAACLAAYRLADGLIDFGTRLRKELASMRKQLATEKRKCGVAPEQARVKERGKVLGKTGTGKSLSAKGKELTNKVDEWAANNTSLIQLSDKIFREIYILKYRDVSPDIRALSVTSLGSWILAYPDHYLDDTHNKYIGWLLSDKEANVRRSSLEVLLRLLQKSDFFSRIQIFLGSFAGRIVEMSRDKDDAVAVEAIRVLSMLARYEALDQESCEGICNMIVEEPVTEIRRAAGEFLVCCLSDRGKGTRLQAGKGTVQRKTRLQKRKKGALRNTAKGFLGEVPTVRRSCEIILELLFTVSKRGAKFIGGADLAVDALWDYVPALRCWEAFVSLLIDSRDLPELSPTDDAEKLPEGHIDPLAKEKESLTEEEKAVVCEMLLASAREASGQGDAARKNNMLRQFEGSDLPGVLMSTKLLPELPQLLLQFQADAKALTALVQLPVHLDMTCFERDGHEEHFEEIVMTLVDITSRHTRSPELVKACANTFKALLSDDNPLQKLTSASLRVGCTAAAKELSLQIRADLSKSEPLAVAAAALRVRSLSELVEPNSSIHGSVVKLLEYQLEETTVSELGDEVTMDAIRIGCVSVVWLLLRVKSRVGIDDDLARNSQATASLTEEEVEEVGTKGAVIVSLLRRFCSSTSFPIFVRIVSLQSLLTILILSRGVEKLAGDVNLPTASGPGASAEQASSVPRSFDLLGSTPNLTVLADAVRGCVLALLEHELCTGVVNLQGSRAKRDGLKELELRDCFATLVQSSFQSVLAGNISHLPILGLLLKRRRTGGNDANQSEWTAYQLCRKYCQQRKLSEKCMVEEEIKALRDAADVANSSNEYHVVRELAELVVCTYEPGEPASSAAKHILEQLITRVASGIGEWVDAPQWLGTLAAVGFAVVPKLSIEGAVFVLEKAEGLVSLIEEEGCLHERPERSLFDTLRNALEAVSAGETPELPVRQRIKLARKPVGVAKKRKKKAADPSAHFSSSPATTANVRKSSRQRKKVDYAKLVGFNRSGSDDDESSDESELEKDNLDSGNASGQPSSAAEVARDLMTFSCSPRVPSAKLAHSPLELDDAPHVPKMPRLKRGRAPAESQPEQAAKRSTGIPKGSESNSEERGRVEKEKVEENVAAPAGGRSKVLGRRKRIAPASSGRRRKRSWKLTAADSNGLDSAEEERLTSKWKGKDQMEATELNLDSEPALNEKGGRSNKSLAGVQPSAGKQKGRETESSSSSEPVRNSAENLRSTVADSGKSRTPSDAEESPVNLKELPVSGTSSQEQMPRRNGMRSARSTGFSRAEKENVEKIPIIVRKRQRKW